MNFEFAIIEEGPYYGRRVWQKMAPVKPYPPQGNGKPTWVYRLASAMEGHSITKDEADRFGSADINGYIHRQIRVTVKHSVPNGQGQQYSNVDSFLPIKKELPVFDVNKVPKENLPEVKKEPTGKEKARAVANSLPGAKHAATGQIEANDEELPVIQQDDPTGGELNPMVNDEPPKCMSVEDIPF